MLSENLARALGGGVYVECGGLYMMGENLRRVYIYG